MPPESWNGYERSKPSSPKVGEQRPHALARSATRRPAHLEAERRVVEHPPPRQQRVGLRHVGEAAGRHAVGRAVDQHLAASSPGVPPVRIAKAVDLPQPLGPRMATNSPARA